MAQLTVVLSWHVRWSITSILPYTVASWRKTGVKLAVIIIGSDKKMTGEAERLKDLCRKADPHVRVIYLAENALQGRINHIMNLAVLAQLGSTKQGSIDDSEFIMSVSPGVQPDANTFKQPLSASHIRAWSWKEMFEFQRSNQSTTSGSVSDDSIHAVTANWYEWRHCLEFYGSPIDIKSRVTEQSGVEFISTSIFNSTFDSSYQAVSARFFLTNFKLVETNRHPEGIGRPVSRESEMTYASCSSSFLTDTTRTKMLKSC